MVSFHLCLNAGSLKTFCSPGGKPRGILAEVSWRLANLIKYCTMKHCLQLWLNCILIYFQSCFCIYLSCKQLPKVRLLYREELWFPFCEGMYLCSIIAVFYFLQPYSFFPMKVTSPSLSCLRIYSTPLIFFNSDRKGCHLSTYYMLFSFETVIRETTYLKILNSSETGGNGAGYNL